MSMKTTIWQDLQSVSAGTFSACASGIARPHLTLMNHGGKEFGRLRIHGPDGAQLEAGPVEAEIKRVERAGKASYRMVSGGEEILLANAAPAETINIVTYEGIAYQVRIGLFRNFAEATSLHGRTARVEGGFLSRRYEVKLGEDDCALPVAIFLLYHLFVARSRAYSTNPQQNTGE